MKIGFNPNFCGLIKACNQKTNQKVTINTDKIQKIEEQKNNCCRILTSEKSRPQYPVGYFIVEGRFDDVIASYNKACHNLNLDSDDYLIIKDCGSC